MAEQELIPFDSLVAQVRDLLIDAGASPEAADIIALNCASCERDGTLSHGIFRLKGYLHSLRTGWADGHAAATVDRVGPSYIRVHGQNGFTQPALAAALPEIEAAVGDTGVAVIAVREAHHTSALWPDLEPYAQRGWVALGMIASGVLMIRPMGADKQTFSTNPIGFATPVEGAPPLVFDFSSSSMSGGDLELHRRAGRKVPLGTGTDANGELTEDPQAITDGGSLLPFGGHKGALVAMMIEMLAAGLTGADFSYEGDAKSKEAPGGAMTFRTGQLFIVIDPKRGGNEIYEHRIASFIEMMREAGMTRMPGDKRYATRAVAERDGVPVTELMRELGISA